MEIGLFSRTYQSSSVKDIMSKMNKEGIYHTQFNLMNAGAVTLPDEIPDSTVNDILNMSNQYQINLDVLSGTFNMIDPDEDARKRGCFQFKTQCEIAKRLKIPVVSLCTGSKNKNSKWKWHEDNNKQSSWDDLLETTEIVLSYAEHSDVILGIEPEISNIIYSAKRARKLLDYFQSNRLKIIVDGANLFHKNEISEMKNILLDTFELLGKDIILAHAKDFCLEENQIKYVAPGKGCLDYAMYIELLQSIEYSGPFIMHGLNEDEIFQSKKYLEEKIKYVMVHKS